MNLLDLLDSRATQYNQKALLMTDDRTYSYADFKSSALDIAYALVNAGVKHGDKVAIIIESYDAFFASLFAVWMAGATAVPLNVSLSQNDLQSLIDRSKSSLLLYEDTKFEGFTIDKKTKIDEIEKTEIQVPLSPLADSDIAVIMFTSGTTGIPKGVVQTFFSQTENAYLTCEKLGLGEEDRVFINTPPYFTSGLCHFTTMLNAGGSLVGSKGFVFGKDLLTKMEQTGSTGFGGAPAHLVRVVSTMEEPYTNPKINFWMSSGDHLPKNIIERAAAILPHVRLFNVYGLTEVSGRFCILRPEFTQTKHGSVGTPIGDMTATVVDADGNPAAPGEIGEINANGNLVFEAYLDMPELTEKAKGPYGFRTGDFGYMDADGFVFVEGRKDDIFKRGGEKVSTNKIKQVLLDLDLFKDVAVVAKDDMLMGKVPVACVVMKDDTSFNRMTILKALRGKIEDTHIPAKIIQLDEIPRTGSGKAIMAKLREIVEE